MSTTTIRNTFTVANAAAQSGIAATGNLFESAATSVGMLHSFIEKEALLQRRGYDQEIAIRTQEMALELTNRTIAINNKVASMDEPATNIYNNLLDQLQSIE